MFCDIYPISETNMNAKSDVHPLIMAILDYITLKNLVCSIANSTDRTDHEK